MRLTQLIFILIFPLAAMAQKAKTTLDLLQGYWESGEDSKNVIRILGHNKITIYDKKEIDRVSFILADSCKTVVNKEDMEDMQIMNGNFFITIDKDGSLCYSIDSLTNNHLTLMYLGSGRLLLFKRKKNEAIVE